MELLQQYFDTAFAAPDGIPKLRELILKLAMQGKLVPQDPNDSPASELIRTIEAEKKWLVKERKIKAPKTLPEVTASDEPYSLPHGWQWVRLGAIGNIFNGNSINASEKESKYAGAEGLPYIATKDVGYGFDSLDYNVVYAQMGRGKMERTVAFAMAGIAATLSKLAFDACMFNSQNFGFIKLPDQFTTGSSIMPHKKNPDVFELTRAKCNKLQGLPQQIILISNNLPSGYFRDLQIIKEVFLPAFDELKDCLRMVTHMMREVKVNEHILDDDKYSLLFSVEEVNRRVLAGMPFRDAYKQVGLDIEAGKFIPSKSVNHTHEGSIGNLCNESITAMMRSVIGSFSFERMNEAEKKLIHG